MKKRTIRIKAKGRGNSKTKAKGRGRTHAKAKGRGNSKTKAKGRGRTRCGGSTTEQIGAAAQMRVYLDPSTATHQLLNEIVHHESRSNRFHDLEYKYDPQAQKHLTEAYKMINRNHEISEGIKAQMRIAKKKAKKSNGIVVPPIVHQSELPAYPELVAPPRPPRVDAVVRVAPESVLRPQPQVQPVQPQVQPVQPQPNIDVARTNLLRSSLGFRALP
jgi:hypothetical protein